MSFKWWILVASCLFGIGLGLGLATPASTSGLISEDLIALEELVNYLATLPQFAVFVIILIKNSAALLLSFIFSPVLCLMPVIALVLNGGILGFIAALVAEQESVGFVLAGLLPHGIFEIPALIIGQAAALRFGTMALLSLFQKNSRRLFLPNLKQNFRYLLIALALLLPAAIIETYITPLLIT